MLGRDFARALYWVKQLKSPGSVDARTGETEPRKGLIHVLYQQFILHCNWGVAMNIQQPEHHNDVHFTGQLFARIPHAFLKDVKDPVAVAVYNHLMVYADWNSGLAHPKRETLARALGYKTTRAVDNAIKHLVEKGWVKTFPRWIKSDPDTEKTTLVYENGARCKQTSNGYIVYDQKQQWAQQDNTEKRGAHQYTPGVDGGSPLGCTTVHTNKNHLNKNHLTNKDMRIPDGKRVDLAQGELVQTAAATPAQPSEQKKPANKYPADFEEWYAQYPRKKAKGDALKAYKAARKLVGQQELVEKTAKYARYVEQSGMEPRFVPYPATWLRAAQWDDEQDVQAPNSSAVGAAGGRTQGAMDIARRMIFEQGYGQNTAGQANTNHRELNW